jgi:hypothetical protein
LNLTALSFLLAKRFAAIRAAVYSPSGMAKLSPTCISAKGKRDGLDGGATFFSILYFMSARPLAIQVGTPALVMRLEIQFPLFHLLERTLIKGAWRITMGVLLARYPTPLAAFFFLVLGRSHPVSTEDAHEHWMR